MNTQDTNLEDLLTKAGRQARLLCEAASGIDCWRTARESATAARIPQGLATGNILREDLDGGLEPETLIVASRALITRLMAHEAAADLVRFVPVHEIAVERGPEGVVVEAGPVAPVRLSVVSEGL